MHQDRKGTEGGLCSGEKMVKRWRIMCLRNGLAPCWMGAMKKESSKPEKELLP